MATKKVKVIPENPIEMPEGFHDNWIEARDELDAAKIRVKELQALNSEMHRSIDKIFVPQYEIEILEPHDELYKVMGGIRIFIKLVNKEDHDKFDAHCKVVYEHSLGRESGGTCSVTYVWIDGIIHNQSGGTCLLQNPLDTNRWNRPIPCPKEDWEKIRAGQIPKKYLHSRYSDLGVE